MHKGATYWRKIRAKAKKLDADGCSGVPEFYRDCCLEHDTHYRTHRTLDEGRITKKQADQQFRECIQHRSKLGKLSPMAQWRYWALRWMPWVQKSWNKWNYLDR